MEGADYFAAAIGEVALTQGFGFSRAGASDG